MAYSGPRIKIRANVRIPARTVEGPGISNVIANGTQTIGMDITRLDVAASIPDPTAYQIAIFNPTLDEWEKTPLSNVPTVTTGDARTGHGDSAYVILSTDRYLALTATLTAPRIWTLPAANAVSGGTRISFNDEAGGISSTNTLTFGVTGADTINGATTFVLNVARSGIEFRSDGSSKWTAGLVGTTEIAPGALSADTAGLAKMADGYLAASTAGRAKMADKFVTLAKMDDIATASLIGRATAGTGVPEIVTFSAAVLSGQQTGSLIKSASSIYTTSAVAFSTVIPLDNTVPQITEGTEIQTVTLAASSATSKIRIRWSGQASNNTAGFSCVIALFKDSGANAIAANFTTVVNASTGAILMVETEFTAGDTSSHTYRARFGPAGNVGYLNGNSGGFFGGVATCALVVEEIKA